ncbi:MAG: hypothetical protein A4E66_01655 [Syntrophus sp. PtaB.Bin001]|nr:MAG: hypothetical protein A4E66_01655 [Syntrophus sp. PtaB.Bin001]
MNPGYTLLRSRRRRKTICLQLKKDGQVIIRAPFFTPRKEIDDFFRAKEIWLRNRLQKMRECALEPRSCRVYQKGETFFFLGNRFPLQIDISVSNPGGLIFDNRRFVLQQDYIQRGREIFIAWYREQAEIHLGRRLNFFCSLLGFVSPDFRITSARSFWGCCSAKNRLAFNWRLIMAPLSVIDYVVVHELQHLSEKNHSAAFWSQVAAVIPDYGEHRRWLRKNGHLLDL